jgi:hypothetical protein
MPEQVRHGASLALERARLPSDRNQPPRYRGRGLAPARHSGLLSLHSACYGPDRWILDEVRGTALPRRSPSDEFTRSPLGSPAQTIGVHKMLARSES